MVQQNCVKITMVEKLVGEGLCVKVVVVADDVLILGKMSIL